MNNKSAASIGLDAIAHELGGDIDDTARGLGDWKPVDLDDAERERQLGMKPMPDPVEPFAPPLALPDYVTHNGDAPRSGMLSAAAIVQEFEATAKEIEKLGAELKAAQERAAKGQEVYAKALTDLTNTAAAFREEAKRVFQQVEDVTAKASEASVLAQELRNKIAQIQNGD